MRISRKKNLLDTLSKDASHSLTVERGSPFPLSANVHKIGQLSRSYQLRRARLCADHPPSRKSSFKCAQDAITQRPPDWVQRLQQGHPLAQPRRLWQTLPASAYPTAATWIPSARARSPKSGSTWPASLNASSTTQEAGAMGEGGSTRAQGRGAEKRRLSGKWVWRVLVTAPARGRRSLWEEAPARRRKDARPGGDGAQTVGRCARGWVAPACFGGALAPGRGGGRGGSSATVPGY